MVLLRKCTTFFLLCGLINLLQTQVQASVTTADQKITITHANVQRTYTVHLPPNYNKQGKPSPMIIAFHGVGGQGDQFAFISDFETSTDKAGFVMVYPDGVNQMWEVGRDQQSRPVDDVGFVEKILQKMSMDYKIDSGKIFAVGISNGGLFTFRLACRAQNIFSKIAVVAMNFSEELTEDCQSKKPVSLIQIMGTNDPVIPFYASYTPVAPDGVSKSLLSAEDTAQFWRKLNMCTNELKLSEIDQLPSDMTKIRVQIAPTCLGKSSVASYFVEGGGHTWPGGKQYFPEQFIGKVSMEMDASEVITRFFTATPAQ